MMKTEVRERDREIGRCYTASSEDEKRSIKPRKECRQLLYEDQGKGMDFPLETPEGMQPTHLGFLTSRTHRKINVQCIKPQSL